MRTEARSELAVSPSAFGAAGDNWVSSVAIGGLSYPGT